MQFIRIWSSFSFGNFGCLMFDEKRCHESRGGVAGRPQKSQVDTGICKPQSDVLYTKLDMPRPHLFEAQVFSGVK